MKLLHIDSSILGDDSVSRTLSAEIVDIIKAQDIRTEVIQHNLADTPLDHLSAAHLMAFQGQEPESKALKADIKAGNAMLADFMLADTIVLGAPMYNLTIPSQLKAWIDRICAAGKTFRYTENGPEGLSGDKKIFIVISRGGFYDKDTPIVDCNYQESYLRILFTFLGITDISFIHAEGIALGPEHREQALSNARNAIKEQLATLK